MEIKPTRRRRWYNKKSEPTNHNNRQWCFSASVWSVACRSRNSICQALLFLSRQEQKEKQTEAYRRKNWFEFRAGERACPLCCFQSVSVFERMSVASMGSSVYCTLCLINKHQTLQRKVCCTIQCNAMEIYFRKILFS